MGTSYGILASDDPQTLSNFGLLNELGVFWFSVFLAGHVSMFPRFLYVVLINSRLTPSRMVHMAFSHHKKALRGVIRADKATLGTLHQQSKTDKNFWTDTFGAFSSCCGKGKACGTKCFSSFSKRIGGEGLVG